MTPPDRAAEIARVDQRAAAIARRVLHPGVRLSVPLLVVRLREPWGVARTLDSLSPPPPPANGRP
jgi:hypothetical protein